MTAKWALIKHFKMDSDRPVGYFRIEMTNARRMFLQIAWMLPNPDRTEVRCLLVDDFRDRVS